MTVSELIKELQQLPGLETEDCRGPVTLQGLFLFAGVNL